MQVDFLKETDSVVTAKAAANGFGDNVAAYLLHLVEKDDTVTGSAAGENALKAFERLGLVGCIKDGPADLSTNPDHMKGFGGDAPHCHPD